MSILSSPLQTVKNWSLSSLSCQDWVKKISDANSRTRYPVKLLRYWFMFNLLVAEQKRLGRELRVCEIGVDRGQMRRFVTDAGFSDIAVWEAVDHRLQPELLESGYTRQIKANVDNQDFALTGQYDVIIVLHLLEHLFEPELLMGKLATALQPDGIIIGGFPVVPKWLQQYRQNKIRQTAEAFGHVSTFSPARVQSMADRSGLALEFLSGTYFLRKRNFFLENFPCWIRLNLYWGALFPALAAEIYWQMRAKS